MSDLTVKLHAVEAQVVLGVWDEADHLVRELRSAPQRFHFPFGAAVDAYVGPLLVEAQAELDGAATTGSRRAPRRRGNP